MGGAGGGGGYLAGTSHAVTAQTYTIVVGAGGVANSGSTANNGTAGSNSSFDTLISIGGGYGAGNNKTGGNGGSGGGSGRGVTTVGTGTSSDITPTDVQDNSIFVETDTARRYWFDAESAGADTTTSNTNVNDIAHFEGTVGANYIIGEQITSGNALIGKTITSLSFWLYKLNSGSSGTETFTFGVWNSSGTNVHEFGTVTRGELPQGSAFGNAVKFTKSTGSYVLQENDTFGLRTDSNPNSAWTVEITQRDSDVYSNGQRAIFTQGSTPATSAKDVGFEVVSHTVTPDTWTMQPTFQDDFSGSDSWTDTDTAIGVTSNEMKYVASGGEDYIHSRYDLGSTVSDTAWVLRLTAQTSQPTANPQLFVGLSSNTSELNASQDFLGYSSVYNDNVWGIVYADGSTVPNSSNAVSSGSDKYYVEIKRESLTQATLNIWTGSYGGTLVESHTRTDIPSTVVDLQYIKFGAKDMYSQTVVYDDIQFYNGVTSIT